MDDTIRTANNKRIAKNSIILYVRLIIVMVCGLMISRIVLDALGASDYGLYTVVGGFVTIFTAITSSLAAATSRFITFELGRNDIEKLKNAFSISITVHIVLGLIILLLLETIGVWYLNYKMVIDPARITAANYALQFSIITLMFNLLNVPYNAALIAHEQMDFFAYVSIGEVLVKLGACLLLPFIPYDSLIVYSLMLMVISIIVRLVYMFYCGRHFEECRYTRRKDKEMLKDMLSFSGWNFIGASSGILKQQGNNVVLNYFFGTIVNAAYGLTSQVTVAVDSLSSGVLNAINPQIIKQYSVRNMEYMFRLVFLASRAAFYLIMLFAIPLWLNTDIVLGLWLKEVPDNTVLFLQISLAICLINTWSQPLITAMLATGDIKKYQIIVGGADILCLPLSYICLKLGMFPAAVYVVMLVISIVTLILRLIMLNNMIDLPWKSFLTQIVGRSTVVCGVSLGVSYLLCHAINFVGSPFITLVINTIVCVTITMVAIVLIDSNKGEREMALSYVQNLFKKKQ